MSCGRLGVLKVHPGKIDRCWNAAKKGNTHFVLEKTVCPECPGFWNENARAVLEPPGYLCISLCIPYTFMYVYNMFMYMYVCMYVYERDIRACTFVCVCTSVHAHLCAYVIVCANVSVCVCCYVCVCAYVHVFVHLYVYASRRVHTVIKIAPRLVTSDYQEISWVLFNFIIRRNEPG